MCKQDKAARTKPAKPNTQPDRGTPYPRTTTTKRKKKTVAGAWPRFRCGARSAGWRRSPCPGWRNTRGNPNPKRGFGVPQHLRKRDREKTSPTNIPTTREREREDTNNNTNKGQVLKGTKPNNNSTPETKNSIQTSQTYIPKTPNNRATHQSNSVSEELSQQGGGAHGPPCSLGESPRGTVVVPYRGVRKAPHHGNRPR